MQVILDPTAPASKKKRTKRFKKLTPPAAPERDFRNRMGELWKEVLDPATKQIQAMVRAKESPAAIASYIESVLDQARIRYRIAADQFLPQWRSTVAATTSDVLMQGMIDALSIDIRALVDDPSINNLLQLSTTEASQLIVSIPEQYLGDVARAVYDNYVGDPLPEDRSLLRQIQVLQKGTKRRAELLARDQTKKLTSSLNQARQESIGVEMYIWRTSKDERVVGKPGGRYPKGNEMHGNHYLMADKYCRWDDPSVYSTDKGRTWKKRTSKMPDNHPGQDINCRCYAEPVIDLDKLLAENAYPV